MSTVVETPTSKQLGAETDSLDSHGGVYTLGQTLDQSLDQGQELTRLSEDATKGKGATQFTRLLDGRKKKLRTMSDVHSDLSHLSQASKGLRRRGQSVKSAVSGMHPRSSVAYPILHASEYIGEASILSCVVSLTNTCIGAGILGLPYAISKLGLVVGISMLCFQCLFTVLMGFLAMTASKTLTEGTTFSDIGWKTFPRMMRVIDVMNILGNGGTCVAYLVIVGDGGPDALKHIVDSMGGNKHHWLLSRTSVMAMFSAVLLLPVIREKTLDNMKYVSMFAMLCFFYIMCATLLYAAVPSLRQHARDHAPDDTGYGDWYAMPHSDATTFLSVIPIVMLAYNSCHNAICLAHELKDNSLPRILKVVSCTMAICFTAYCFVGISVYTTYGRKTESDFLLNYPNNSWVFTIARLAFTFAVCMSFPVMVFTVRESISFTFLNRSCLDPETTTLQFYILTYGLFAVSFMIAVATSDLGVVMALSGLFASLSSAYIVPGLAFWNRCTPHGGAEFYSPYGDSSKLQHPDDDTESVGLPFPGGRQPVKRVMMPPLIESPADETDSIQKGKDKDASEVKTETKPKAEEGFGVRLLSDSGEMWNVWPKWLGYYAITTCVLGFCLVPLFVTVQFV